MIVTASLLLAACGGGGGGGGSSPSVVPTTTGSASQTSTAKLSTSGSTTVTLPAIATGYSANVTLPSSTPAGNATLTLAATDPSGASLASSARITQAIGGSLSALAYLTIVPAANLTFANLPSMTFVLPAGFSAAGNSLYLAYNPGNTAGGWQTLAGPATVNAGTVVFTPSAATVTLFANTTYAFALFSTSQTLQSANEFSCPSSTSARAFGSTQPAAGADATLRRPFKQKIQFNATGGALTTLAVNYDRSTAASSLSTIQSRESSAGASFVRSFDYPKLNFTQRLVTVPSATAAQAEATLRAQPGVQSVAVAGARRFRTAATAPYVTNDPYFVGFPGSVPSGAFYSTSYHEGNQTPGQWNMWDIGLPYAFAYSTAADNNANIANASALGSSSIKIAIIDTGVDASHPELASKVVSQHCFITENGSTSTGSYAIDEDGHGTDVAGIAAAAGNNGLGFVGAGGNTTIMAYRVFPTPDDSCASGSSADQCGANTADIASAIDDAVANGANIISMSLGGDNCGTGQGYYSNGDSAPDEGAAVANAIAHNVIVVAASGNSGTQGVTAPGCDTGVIAVGATSLADGTPTGTSAYTSSLAGGATSTHLVEYVASYSQYGSPGANLRNASAWGIVAPGGDPADSESSGTPDDLHWIEDIWTSTPFGGQADVNFAGNCQPDLNSSTGSDCRTLIAGTSMATPHVAGVAALILAVTGGSSSPYQSPSAMKQLLCTTADDISDTHQGCGRVNAYTAMATVLHDPSPPTPVP